MINSLNNSGGQISGLEDRIMETIQTKQHTDFFFNKSKKGTTEDEMAGWHHGLDGHEFEQTP